MTVAGRKTVCFDALRNRKSERKRGELMKGGVFGALSLIAVLTAVPALATDPAPAAFKTVASQAYVDLTRQSTISATSDGTNNTPNYVYNQSTNPTAAGSVVTTTTTAGTVGERGIANAPVSNGSGGYSNGDWLPTVNAMMGAINTATNTLSWTATETTAVGNYSTTFDGQTGNWPAADADKLIDGTALATALSNKQNKIIAGTAGNVVTYTGTAGTVGSATVSSAATYTNDTLQNGDDIANITAVETKQDKIVASDILLLEEDGDAIPNDIYTPSIVTHDSNDETLVGTQFGILSNSVIDDADIGWEPPYLYDFDDRDDLVPTVAAIIPELDHLWDGIDNVYNAKQDILTKQLYTTIVKPTTNLTPVGGETIDIQGDNTNSSVGRRYITGTGSQALTTKSGADTVLSYVNGTKSLSEFQTSNFGASGKLSADLIKNNTYIRGALVSLDLLRDTYAELDSKISDAVSAIDFDTLTWDTAETAAANAYSTTFSDSGTNTWPESDENELVAGAALANALSLKQNKVTTGLVLFDDQDGTENDVYVPALVATDSTGSTINGNTIGIVSAAQIKGGEGIDLNMFYYAINSGYKYDNFVPTLSALGWVYTRLRNDIDSLPKMTWDSEVYTNPIKRYYTTFSSNSGYWPAGDVGKLVTGSMLANALALKQSKMEPEFTQAPDYVGNDFYRPAETAGQIPYLKTSGGQILQDYIYITAGAGAYPLTAKSGADNVILYVNGTKTLDEFRISNFGNSTNGTNYIKGIYINRALVSLGLLHDTYADLDAKITAVSRPTGTTGTVATYNGVTNGVQQFTETAIYDTANAYNASTDAGKLATAGFVATKQDKIPAKANGDPTKIVTYPAYGSAAGAIGELSVDTSTLYTTDDSHVPSSKLVSTSLAGKQNQIPAGNALFLDNEGTENDLYLPGLVAYDSTTQSLKGDQIGILSYGNMQDWQLDNILTLLDYPLIADKAVPTVGSVATSLANLVNSIENAFVQKQNVLSPQLTATTGKTDLVPAGGETIAFDPESDELSPRYITGAGTEGLTTKTGANSVIDYVNGTVALDGMQISNFGALLPGDSVQLTQKNKNYIKKALVSLETLKDVYSELNTKITAVSRPTGTTGTVATYNGVTNGVQQFTETAIYDTANAYNASTDAGKLATAGFVATKQNQIGATTSTYVYDSTNNPNAAGSVVTTTTTAGTVGQRGIANAPVSNGSGGYTNGDWLPTVNAMMGAISTATNALTWTSTETTAVGNYSTTFDGQTGNWPAADADKKVDGTALAAALATKQNKMVCTGWSSDTHTDANCWIWSIE